MDLSQEILINGADCQYRREWGLFAYTNRFPYGSNITMTVKFTHLQIPTKARVVRIESDGIGDCIFKMDELSRTLMLGMVSKFLTQRVEVTPLSDPIAFYTPHSRE